MSKTFKFSDSLGGHRFDARRGGRASIWSRTDLNYAVVAYCRNHSPDQLVEILYHCARVTHPDHVPSHAFGAIIGMIVQEITDRPHEDEVAHRPTLRLPFVHNLGKPKDIA